MNVPGSLELLDVARGLDAERFLWIRGLADPQLPRLERIDLLDAIAQVPGELLHVVSRDGTMAASLMSLTTAGGTGSCYLDVHCATDPGEPALGALVDLACDRAEALALEDLRCGAVQGRPHLAALTERHGFAEWQRWRRFHVDVRDASTVPPLLPAGSSLVTLRDRPDLAEAVTSLRQKAFTDLPDDSWVQVPRAAEWLRELDSAPTLGRQLVLVLLDSKERVLAHVELKRLAAASEDAWVEFLAVDRGMRRRGLASLLKQHVVAHARTLGMRRLQTINHVHNVAACTLNERLGWIEDAPRIQLRRAR